MHKRSDLLAVFGNPTQANPLYFNDVARQNKPIGSLDAKILHAPIRICKDCNNARTQPYDLAWERMSESLRGYDLKVGQWLRPARVFPYRARQHMLGVHLYFLKLFGCMLEEAKATGHDLGIDVSSFSDAIMSGRPHPDVLLRFGKCDGEIGRSNLFAWKSPLGHLFASWLYQLDTIAVGITYAPPDEWATKVPHWHPNEPHYSRRLQIADFMYRTQYAPLKAARRRIVDSLIVRSNSS